MAATPIAACCVGGNVTINNLDINHTLAQGAAGGDAGGGGGAGLGGGLSVASAALVSINNVNFSGDRAIGGAGGRFANSGDNLGGGGGGMGTAESPTTRLTCDTPSSQRWWCPVSGTARPVGRWAERARTFDQGRPPREQMACGR